MFVLIILTLIHGIVGEKFSASSCHYRLKSSNVDLNQFYPSLEGSKSLPLLRYSSDWDNSGVATDTCAIILEECETCKCDGTLTPMIIEALDWKVKCIDLPPSVTQAEKRTINSGKKEDSGKSSVQSDESELTGDEPSSGYDQLIQEIQDQEVVPTSETQPNTAANSNGVQMAKDEYQTLNSALTRMQPRMLGASGGDPRLRKFGVLDSSATTSDVPVEGFETTSAPSDEDTTDTDNLNEKSDLPESTEETEKDEVTEGVDVEKQDDETTTGSPTTTTKTTTKKSFMEEYFGASEQLTVWKKHYYVVLAAFLIFSITFIIIIIALYARLKKAERNNVGNISPGPGVVGSETEPLTPQVQGSFKFDEGSLPR